MTPFDFIQIYPTAYLISVVLENLISTLKINFEKLK